MIIVGLTGSVASGKSTVAGWMRDKGIAVHDADEAVHSLLAAKGQAVADIISAFGSDIRAPDGGIDRNRLGEKVFANPNDRKKLESILHPLVRRHRDQFLQDQQHQGSQIVVLDVPLLYETGGEILCNYVIVVYARAETIWRRALARPGMTAEKLKGILSTQLPASDKCQRADLVLDSDLDLDITRQHLFNWLGEINATLDISKR